MRFLQTAIRSLLLVRCTPERTALAFSVGVFFGFSPFVGLHTVLGLATASVCRLNKTAVLIGLFSNNPWILPLYYGLATCFGVQLMGLPEGISIHHIRLSDLLEAEFWYWLATQWRLVIPAFVGSSVLSILFSLLAYPLALLVIRRYMPGDEGTC